MKMWQREEIEMNRVLSMDVEEGSVTTNFNRLIGFGSLDV